MTDTYQAGPPPPPALLDGHRPVFSAALQPAVLTPHERRVDRRHSTGSIPIEDADPADLRRKLATLPVIEQAKGMLMGLYGCTAATAYEILQRWSSHHNLKVRVLCTDMVAAAGQPHTEPFGALRAFLRSHHLS